MLAASPLFADLPLIRLQYQQGVEFPSSYALLEKQLKAIPQILDVQLDQNTAVASIRWKPNVPFSFSQINLASRSAGANLDNVLVTVRGTVEEVGTSYQIRSLGDNTIFKLLGPYETGPGQVAARETTQGRKLTPEQKQKLQAAQAENLVITVTGSLLNPTRYLELYLDIEKISLPTSREK